MIMTDEGMARIDAIEKQANTDLFCEMLAFTADRIIELEVVFRTEAPKGTNSHMREGAAQRIPPSEQAI